MAAQDTYWSDRVGTRTSLNNQLEAKRDTYDNVQNVGIEYEIDQLVSDLRIFSEDDLYDSAYRSFNNSRQTAEDSYLSSWSTYNNTRTNLDDALIAYFNATDSSALNNLYNEIRQRYSSQLQNATFWCNDATSTETALKRELESL